MPSPFRGPFPALSPYLLILGILYLSFISLGLPDSVLGPAWPAMRLSLNKPLEYAGMLLTLTTVMSVISSAASGWVMSRMSVGVIITVCGFGTATAMFGYALSPAWGFILAFTLLFGLGQGAVDTAVNVYMARHYSARHMNWVHACWGIGATGGPLIMTTVLGLDLSWRTGYVAIGLIQALLSTVFLFSLPLWKKAAKNGTALRDAEERTETASGESESKRDGADTATGHPEDGRRAGSRGVLKAATANILFYFLYPGAELVTGLWSASYMVDRLKTSPVAAGLAVTGFWAALTCGRVLAGLVSPRLGTRALIRLGMLAAGCGAALVTLTLAAPYAPLFQAGLVLLGAGLGPLYPSMMHDTPVRLGALADKVTGIQVGAVMAGGGRCFPPWSAGWPGVFLWG